jgi:hypothetical protein
MRTTIKILFICGSLEPGKDGVGDYTRRLCGELIRRGNSCAIISLCDHHVNEFSTQIQEIEETTFLVHRIPVATTNKQRLIFTQEIVTRMQPDWISLQFVPYSFNAKGLPFWLPTFLSKLQGIHKWHIMFHELWLGISRESSLKDKVIGLLQKGIINKVVERIEPKVVHTQAKVYQYYLSKLNVKAYYLPLFGNITVSGSKKSKFDSIVFVIFATIHDKAPFANFVADLKKELQHSNKLSKFIFVGRNGSLLSSWTALLDENEIEFEILGSCSEETISELLSNSSYGISTTPYKISDKSGVVAAYREHQLPILSIAKTWTDIEDIAVRFDDIYSYQKESIQLSTAVQMENNSLNSVCKLFLHSIHLSILD